VGAARDPGLDAAVPFRFACSRCGHCCSGGDGYAWLEPDEVEPLARALDVHIDSFAALFVREAVDPRRRETRLALRQREDGRCVLLEGRNTCRAYGARPRHCRDFPYWPGVLAGGAGFEAARATCPGIAVVVVPERARTAHERLGNLYATLDEELAAASAVSRPAHCCLEADASDELFMTALEADFAADRGRADAHCRLGAARPLGCRVACADADTRARAHAALRSIERETDYPAAYGAAHALLAARGQAAGELEAREHALPEQAPAEPRQRGESRA
jgi:Fe-S-cluster containining protein